MSLFTIFGGRGFIGTEFVEQLKLQGHDIFVPERDDLSIYDIDLGIVIYTAGYGDCKKNPFNVVEANLGLLSSILKNSKFSKLVYISSTRVYMNQLDSYEYCDLKVCSSDDRKLFNLTKLAAEELCLKSERECLIFRPSNVFGLALNSPLFLPAITRNAINHNLVEMYVDKDYSKDYIYVSDVVKSILEILKKDISKNEIINIASGNNVRAIDIANILEKETGCNIVWHNNVATQEIFPVTDVSVMNEFIDFTPINVLDALTGMIKDFKRELGYE